MEQDRAGIPVSEDEIAAYHESAHAVMACSGDWTRLAGPVSLEARGHGDVAVGMDRALIAAAIRCDPDFDHDAPRLELVYSFLAGATVERELVSRGMARILEVEIVAASTGDYAQAAAMLRRMSPSRAAGLPAIEADLRALIGRPVPWCLISRFATRLIQARMFSASDAAALIQRLGDDCASEFGVGDAPRQSPPGSGDSVGSCG